MGGVAFEHVRGGSAIHNRLPDSIFASALQAANTLTFVWKLMIASGIVWRRRWLVIPVPYYDAKLHASAKEGHTQACC